MSDRPANGGVSRRSFMQTLGLSAAAGSVTSSAEALEAQKGPGPPRILGPDDIVVGLQVNGELHETTIDPATTLLEALRVSLNLTGSKEICDRGSCGGCSVLVDGRLVASCMMLAVDARDAKVTTVEGLANGDELHPLQESFIRHDALQCGYCTPGLLMASKALLDDNPKPSLDQVKKGLCGNICRCGTYSNVFNAVLDASGQEPVRDSEGS